MSGRKLTHASEWLDRSLTEIAAAIDDGQVASEHLVAGYIDRIETLDRQGPALRSVLALNPNALASARERDREASRGPLHGVPVLIKDNIETQDALATTAGSLALAENFAERDSPLVAGLRSAGAVILGKANLSEWANFRSTSSLSGWSALGGQVRNPHVLDRSPGGSSSGSGAAVAAGLCAAAVGTETLGSVISPASANGVVGFKPTVGLVSQQGIVPISSSQDTAGPLSRSVADAAALMGPMAGASLSYASRLSPGALQGRRVAVARFAVGAHQGVSDLFDAALDALRAAGAELIEIPEFERESEGVGRDTGLVLRSEFRETINRYLAAAPPAVGVRNLEDLVRFNREHEQQEMPLFRQELFERCLAAPPLDSEAYQQARLRLDGLSRAAGIDRLLQSCEAEVLVAPSGSPAPEIDPVCGERWLPDIGLVWFAAVAGYPHLTVPMGAVHSLPVGISFVGTAGADAEVLAAGYAYELRAQQLRAPRLLTSLLDDDRIAMAMRPLAEREFE